MTASPSTGLGGFGRTQTALMRFLLRNKDGLTVDDIAAGLGVTRTAVNQHLTALERDGYVVRREAVKTGGRPSRLFALSEKGVHLFPKNYDLFSLKALEALIDTVGASAARKVLTKLGRELGAGLSNELAGKPIRERMPAIRNALQSFGFDAVLEETSPRAAPEISAYNCIYHTLAQAHPDVCALDLALLEKAADGEVEHLSCMAKGDNCCRFRFRK